MQRKNKVNIENKVMNKILSGEVKMKPKWYFVLGSMLSYIGLIGSIIGATFFTNLTLFLFRKQGPGIGRIYLMLKSFPIWIPFLALGLFLAGIWLLKKFDFSYKKNFIVIIIILLTAVFLSAKIISVSGLNDVWSKRGPMKRFYTESYNGNVKSSNKTRDHKRF